MIKQYEPSYNREEIKKQIAKYVSSNSYFSEFEKTKEFEENIVKYLKVKHCITCNNGTMALVLALLANGIKKDDLVAIPNITMMSTQAAIELIGARPIFIDVNNKGIMDIEKVREYSQQCKAIIYVTLNGRSHVTDKLTKFYTFCKDNNIKIIEDNCQSFGSKDDNYRHLGCKESNIGCFSFSFHKLISCGQGGACVTNDDVLANKLRELKNVGRLGMGDIHNTFGINSKFTDIQAIIGNIELKSIDYKIEQKRNIYIHYYNNLKDVKELTMYELKKYETPWFVDIYLDNRDELCEFLTTNNIETRKIYPQLTSQKINEKHQDLQFTMSKIVADKGVWLPSSLSLTQNEINDVCEKIKLFFKHKMVLQELKKETQ